MTSPLKVLTPAPTQSPLVSNLSIEGGSAWWTWFDLLWRYVRGFNAESLASDDAQMNITYTADSVGLLTYTLPTQFTAGDFIQIKGKGAGGWRIQLNPGQVIHGISDTSSGGTLSSTNRYNTVRLEVLTDNTELSVVAYMGTLTYA